MSITGSLTPMASISGRLSSVDTKLSGHLSGNGKISGQVNVPERIDIEVYDGDYIVDPHFNTQTLETKNKAMRDDVTINEIAVSKVTNPQGGNTVWIGVL